MNLFITGGTGFFGKALLRYWQVNPPNFEKIYLLSRSPEAFLKKYSDLLEALPIEFIKGNILNLSDRSFNEVFDVVLHAATDSTIGPALDRLDVYHQISHGTEEVLKFAVKHNCKKIILTSSGAVYGSQPAHLEEIPEDYLGIPDPLDPNSAYGIGKRAAEHLTALYADKFGFDYHITRCFAFIGEDLPLDRHFAIGNFINDVRQNKNIKIKGDGTPIRSYLYQWDLARVLDYLLTRKIEYTVLNIGSDESYPIQSIARFVNKVAECGKDIHIEGGLDNNIKSKYVPKIDIMKRILGDSEILSLEKSIKMTLERLKKIETYKNPTIR